MRQISILLEIYDLMDSLSKVINAFWSDCQIVLWDHRLIFLVMWRRFDNIVEGCTLQGFVPINMFNLLSIIFLSLNNKLVMVISHVSQYLPSFWIFLHFEHEFLLLHCEHFANGVRAFDSSCVIPLLNHIIKANNLTTWDSANFDYIVIMLFH